MHTDIAFKEKAAEDCRPQGHTDASMVSDNVIGATPLATLKTEFAKRGHRLEIVRTGADAKRFYMVSRWSHARVFDNLHDLEAFLVQIGGAV